MRRERALKRGRWLSILLAGIAGFLIGDWHATSSRPAGLSPAENVALRFVEVNSDAAVADVGTGTVTNAPTALVLGDAQLALLNPEPMIPPSPVAQPAEPASVQAPVPEEAAPASPPNATPAPSQASAPTPPTAELKSAAERASRRASRPGFLLNDAQIASIKTRLHLTPDQERMWPAVEAALRNIAYARARDARRRGARGGATEVASLDPDSAAVQGLKSAAVPLIMSFSDEQKNQVRSLAHVMGLDKLASEF
jgi:hypothetical protein